MITCVSNGRKCDGICREQNLKRETMKGRRCCATGGWDDPVPLKDRRSERVFGERLNIGRTSDV